MRSANLSAQTIRNYSEALRQFSEFLGERGMPTDVHAIRQLFTPWTYAIACISFDWLIAIHILIAYGLGLVRNRRLCNALNVDFLTTEPVTTVAPVRRAENQPKD
jgi:hypothetical protein